jgi:heat shock protein HslJ
MYRPLLACLLGASLAGCASHAPTLQTDTAYQVEWIGERPLIDRSHLTMTLGSDGRAYGNAGCNHWFASYEQQGERLTFGPAGSTRKLCAPAIMEQEARFLASLETVEHWDISPIDQLRLWPASGKPLRLSAQ